MLNRISILKDKLPVSVVDKAHIAIELSQKEKLFMIENEWYKKKQESQKCDSCFFNPQFYND